MYKYTDRIVRELNHKIVLLFGGAKRLLRQDELNVLSGSKILYEKLDQYTRYGFLQIARQAYRQARKRVYAVFPEKKPASGGSGEKEPRPGKKEKELKATWLDEKLKEYDPITGYVFAHEMERKQSRFAESVIAQRESKNIKTAMDLFAGMVAQYAIEVTDAAAMQSYKDNGVEYVKWNTERDNRVCKTCKDRNGKIYRIDQVPQKPHYHCRCYLTPVLRSETTLKRNGESQSETT